MGGGKNFQDLVESGLNYFVDWFHVILFGVEGEPERLSSDGESLNWLWVFIQQGFFIIESWEFGSSLGDFAGEDFHLLNFWNSSLGSLLCFEIPDEVVQCPDEFAFAGKNTVDGGEVARRCICRRLFGFWL